MLSVPNPRKKVFTRLQIARRAAGLTQPELSARTGVSQRLISNLETGTRDGSMETYQKLARALSVSVSYLAGEQAEDWQEGGGRDEILKDPLTPPGLLALARNAALSDLLVIAPEEWAALRAIELPYALTQEAYLAILQVIRTAKPQV